MQCYGIFALVVIHDIGILKTEPIEQLNWLNYDRQCLQFDFSAVRPSFIRL